MYDLLNTQARLSRQKEHLQLPKRHTLHPEACLFRVFVWRDTEYPWLTLKPWKLRRLRACRKCSEHCRRCSAFKNSGNCGPNFGWCHSLPGSLKKNGFTFPMLSGSSFNITLCPCCSCLFAAEENQNLTRTRTHELLWPISLFSCGLLLRRLTACVNAWTCCGPGRWAGDGASWCWWLPSWGMAEESCCLCELSQPCFSVGWLRLSLHCM